MTQQDYKQIIGTLNDTMAKLYQVRERLDRHLLQCSQCPYWYENTAENFPSISDEGDAVCSECVSRYEQDCWATYEDISQYAEVEA